MEVQKIVKWGGANNKKTNFKKTVVSIWKQGALITKWIAYSS